MNNLNADQKYLVDEFYEHYRDGDLTRRQFIKLLAYITGSMAATVAMMSLLGCTPDELPNPTDPMPELETTPLRPPTQAGGDATPEQPASSGLTPVPGAQSPLSVPEGDPAVLAQDITFASGSDSISAYFTQPAGGEIPPIVLVCHENRGLTLHIRDVARRFAKAGYAALAIDLLSRGGGSATLDPSQIPGLLGNAGTERHVADFLAGYAYLQTLSTVDSARVGMTGYCFGGGITWDVATSLPELKAAVPFYGRAPSIGPVSNIKAAVLGVYAEQDSRINAGIPALEQALKDAGITYQFNIYPGVDHAFHNDTGGRYVEAQATQAWMDTLAWFEQYL
ncbi:MAG TPA: dienelactone hydrolase family protein [Anaerolineales bacterium]|nr:dienelactone hydrolase family protein [Anaerolineales bacterium]